MTASGKLSQQERDAILKALRAGKSQNATAREVGRDPATVNRIAKAAGLQYCPPKNLTQARRDYSQAERLLFLNEIFDKARSLLPGITAFDDLQRLAVTAGIIIDKRRLEDGEVTSRSENVNADVARERVASFVDELATRRRAKEATG